MLQPPRTFKVLGQKFKVYLADRDMALFNGAPRTAVGATDQDAQTVTLRALGPGGVSPAQQVETVLHEAMHAIFYTAGLRGVLFDDDHDKEENFVWAFAPQLLHFLRENPRVVEYLTQRLP